MPNYEQILRDQLNNLGSIKTTSTMQEPKEKYEQKFNFAQLIPIVLMLLSDPQFMKSIQGLINPGGGIAEGGTMPNIAGIGSASGAGGVGGGASGIGSLLG